MFDPKEVKRLNIPQWEAVYRSEILPGIISFIAIHDTSRGWALGGCRMANYDNESTALTDVLRLSRGMTFKNAISDLPLGGGKSIIVCDPKIKGKKRENTLKEFGKFVAWVNSEKDVYCTAEDMNTTVDDMNIVKKYCKNIFGTSIDPSPYTAHGVFSAIEYAVDYFAMDLFHGRRNLCRKRILIQGLGKVGMMLMQLLSDAGMEVYVTDIREEKVQSAVKKFPDSKTRK
jgi:leucine dehydrogenase